MPSTSFLLPSRAPQRAPSTKYGTLLIDSAPPATTTLDRPSFNSCVPRITAFKPEPHAWFTVYAAIDSGIPARTDICRAGFGPPPA